MNRPTRNTSAGSAYLDLLAMVRDIAAVHKDDGLAYDAGNATAEVIRDEEEYSGVRVRLIGHLSRARIPFHIDVTWATRSSLRQDNCKYPVFSGELSPCVGPAIHGVCREDRHSRSTRDGQHSLA